MKALVTRPREDSGELAAALAARGIEPVLEPLLTVRFATDGASLLAPLLEGAQAVLFTSANGVRAFAAASARRDLPAFAVGDATAQAARDAGFAEVASAGGDAADLAALVRQRLKPEDGALVHAAARENAGDLAGALAVAGFELRPALLYEALPAERLSGETVSMLAAGEVALALFFSPRTGGLFVRLASAAGLEPACRTMAAVVLSPAVAAALEPLAWRAVHVAEAPTLTALLAATDRAVAEGNELHVSGGDSMTDERSAADSVLPAPVASRPKRRLGAGPWLLSAFLIALIIVGTVPYWAPPLLPLLPWGRSEAPPPPLADLQARVDAAEAALTRLEAQAVQQQTAPAAQPDAAALQALGQRIDALERRAQPSSAADEIQPLKEAVQQTSARLDAAEARLGRVAATETASDTSDIKLLAALANLRAALAGSAPYQDELATVTALGHGDPKIADALKPLAADAATGLPDIALLAERFRTETAPAIRRAMATVASDEGTIGERALARIEGLVTIRRVGDDAAKADPVERARAALGNGDLAAAVAALKTLGGAPADAARPWLDIAERRVAADAAVADLARQLGGRLAAPAPAAPGERN